ncbi:hypothetical protein [Crocosphaera sp. XPORK-15E]|uniref:hypothetical protein n=1 Tax=Crocosphaera sp. XPORK-15E TaxID=3110247 RepID=UPI002B20F79D|nr:hypothetical protein [Crocosphaera sp. XPORK-15E]MEA5532615.1 hypothetical protein [Crocosphaera sp. XPORK-15E]
MDAFSPLPPAWTQTAIHGLQFCCPRCHEAASKAQKVWINRQSLVMGEDYRRRWQEFYYCDCEQAWWGWSSDRPPSDLTKKDSYTNEQ